MKKVLPTRPQLAGLLGAVLIASGAFGLSLLLPVLSPLLLAILLGVTLRNTGLIPPWADPGLGYASRTILRLGVVLLGLRLSIPQMIDLGPGPIVVIVGTVVGAYLVTLFAGSIVRAGHATTVLTATGTAICGAAAVAGVAAVVRPGKREDVEDAAATAIALVTLFGTLGMFAFPPLANVLGLSPEATGVWLGAAIHEVGQVVGAAGMAGVTDVATVTKLGRVVLLAPLVAIVGVIEARRVARSEEEAITSRQVDDVLAGRPVSHPAARPAPLLPAFVLGFVALVALRSVIGTPESLVDAFGAIDTASTFLLTVAMGAMGTGVRLASIRKAGGRAMVLGAVAFAAAGIISLALTIAFV